MDCEFEKGSDSLSIGLDVEFLLEIFRKPSQKNNSRMSLKDEHVIIIIYLLVNQFVTGVKL